MASEPSVNGNNDAAVTKTREEARRRILVVDDFPLAAETLMRILQLEGHDVRIARDGATAVEAIRFHRPDIVLLDIGFPGMDGYEVALSIRKLPCTEGLILIALTGYGQDEDRRRSKEAGFNYHLTKPVDVNALCELISPLGKIDGRRLAHSCAAGSNLS